MRETRLSLNHQRNSFISVLVAIVIELSVFANVCNAGNIDNCSFFDYCKDREIISLADFIDVCETYNSTCSIIESEIIYEPDSFQIEFDHENRIVIICCIYDLTETRGTKSGSAYKSYYNDIGIEIFSVSVNGVFTYTSNTCVTNSRSGSFSPSPGSSWNSTPNVTSGNHGSTVAYAKISGSATNLSSTINYSLELTCNNAGELGAN